MNKVTIQGMMASEPALKISANGKYKYTNFILAVKRDNNRKGTDYIPCKAWGQKAEVISQKGKKNSPILISSGHISSHFYEDKSGSKHSYVEVIIEEGKFLGSEASENFQQEQYAEANNSF